MEQVPTYQVILLVLAALSTNLLQPFLKARTSKDVTDAEKSGAISDTTNSFLKEQIETLRKENDGLKTQLLERDKKEDDLSSQLSEIREKFGQASGELSAIKEFFINRLKNE